MLRWALKLQEYSFTVKYIKGDSNAADGLSRNVNAINLQSNGSYQQRPFTDTEKINVLKNIHLESGHGSFCTMKFLMEKNYNWPKLNSSIIKFIKSCRICLKDGY
ncbi:hypothetical protein COBT_004206, partial [Conglomerata obtusa]